ncbi:NAD(P)/FAD-dependent oxidoreductase [Microterricola pindariensis]|uniref:Pyridine nucleotide-disulfide oxidoreductase n=1 Tax=Microterricola pindariensis TaxID=478010 RepID=A0ABX5AWA5_9MICO|nr:FAD/NAD(P)-binding oxidoreductase [Microterricola pindariensis]PPL19170.1 pyridine nucleotide-disulfide oxidoreductase [Microterricola pindariensis]
MSHRSVLVIGAGPAGLAAARAARAAGASVTLLDSSDYLGGQYWRHLPAARPAGNEKVLHHGWSTFSALRRELEADAGCEIVLGAQVWALETAHGAEAPTVHALIGPVDGIRRSGRSFTADALVLATGAHDRTLPFPGWDLPGVFTAGAAQAFAKGERVAVGSRVVVAGAGPFLLPVAASLTQSGARVLGVYEANGIGRLLRGWLPRPWRLLGASKKAGEALGYLRNHLGNRIPYRTGQAVIAAHGTDRVEAVTIAKLDAEWRPIPSTARRVSADAVCVSHGFTPRLELPIAAGCALDADRFVTVDGRQATTTASVYAAGEITGIGGVDAALAEGQIAGHCAAGGHQGDPVVKAAVAARATFTDFASRIEAAHGIRPGWTAWLHEDTLVCRCEEVSYGRLCSAASATDSASLRSQKLSSRAGLGICQGRVCGRTVEQILAAERPGGMRDGASTDRRPIVAPVRIGELAAAAADQTSSPTLISTERP